jgi:phosphoribosylanthranilate isomerase
LTHVKFCGITRLEDLQEALRLQTDYVGLVTASPESPRNLPIREAAALRKKAAQKARVVAVTTTTDQRQIEQIRDQIRPDVIQIHGQLPRPVFKREKSPLMWKVVTPMDMNGPLTRYGRFDGLMVDASDKWGTNPTELIEVWKRFGRWRLHDVPLILGGGLTAQNVNEAIRLAQPDIVDVSSGIESSPGIKDHSMMRMFMDRVRSLK